MTKKQKRLLDFVREFIETYEYSPSYEEMQWALGLKSKSGVHRLITSLAEQGHIQRLPYRARAVVLSAPSPEPPAAPTSINFDKSVWEFLASKGLVVEFIEFTAGKKVAHGN